MIEIIKDVNSMMRRATALYEEEAGVALVPTMGALHEGHLSLIREARNWRPVVVVSIFVNPTQFGPGEDYASYPRDFERDGILAEHAGASIAFAPSARDMYPEGFQTAVEVSALSAPLCGHYRPDHFRGVATVVLKLFNIVRPEVAVFGEKDYQQLAVIRRMAEDLNLNVEIVGHPIVRETDGLALSSRNAYIAPKERRKALCLYRALTEARAAVLSGEPDAGKVREIMIRIVRSTPGASLEYAAVADPRTLEEIQTIGGETLLALAVKIGSTRLIDNMVVSAAGE